MINLTMVSGTPATIQYHHDSGLIMLHSEDISAQWKPDHIGIQLTDQIDFVKLGFWSVKSSPDYQSFHFYREDMDKLYSFFKALGYPLHGAVKFTPEFIEKLQGE